MGSFVTTVTSIINNRSAIAPKPLLRHGAIVAIVASNRHLACDHRQDACATDIEEAYGDRTNLTSPTLRLGERYTIETPRFRLKEDTATGKGKY
jgi:hypothetical protein